MMIYPQPPVPGRLFTINCGNAMVIELMLISDEEMDKLQTQEQTKEICGVPLYCDSNGRYWPAATSPFIVAREI